MVSRLAFPLIIAITLLAGLVVLARQSADASILADPSVSTLCVAPGGAGSCYDTIQSAVIAASDWDMINVASGTYPEHVTVNKPLKIYGAGIFSTTIDGGFTGQSTVSFDWHVIAGSVFSGFKVVGGGTGDHSTSTNYGGGIAMSSASPLIQNVWVDGCTAKKGGGVRVWQGSPTFDNFYATYNQADEYGGGIALQDTDVTMLANIWDLYSGDIWFNQAGEEGGGIYSAGSELNISGYHIYWNSIAAGSTNGYGGGVNMYNISDPVEIWGNHIAYNTGKRGGGIAANISSKLNIHDNWIDLNTASYEGGGAWIASSAGHLSSNIFSQNIAPNGQGGGIYFSGDSANMAIQKNTFDGNQSGQGGGMVIAASFSPVLVDSNTVINNKADLAGGIFLYQSAVTLTNNIIARNVASETYQVAGGIDVNQSPAMIINNTIAENTGDGIYFYNSNNIQIINNIISGNNGDGIERDSGYPTTIYTVDYNDVYNNYNTLNYQNVSYSSNELQVDPDYKKTGLPFEYFHINDTSPIKNNGSTAWAPIYDIDGYLRRFDGSVSRGADELGPPLYHVFLPIIRK